MSNVKLSNPKIESQSSTSLAFRQSRYRLAAVAGTLTLLISFFGTASAVAPTFGAATNFAAGSGTRGLAVSDLNGDGKQDIVVTNQNDGNVSVLLGNGLGTFGPATNFPAQGNANYVAIADVNGDSKVDLVITGQVGVSILLGTGTGSFGAPTNYNTGISTSTSVAIGDLNGDAFPDLAVTDTTANTVSILFGTGGGAFGTPTDISLPSGSFSVAIGDLNGDGKPDLVVANQNADNVSVLLRLSGGPGFAAPINFPVGAQPRKVVIADLTGDGKPDLVTANQNGNNVSVLIGAGTGSFGAATNFAAGNSPSSVAIADFDGDGKLDLATANRFGNNVTVLPGLGGGSFGASTAFSVGTLPQPIAVGNFNADSKPDLATANFSSNNVSVLLNTTVANPLAPLTLIKAFGVASFPKDGATTLTFTATNPNATPVTNVSFTDTFPAGLAVASPSAVGGTCNGTKTAVAGALSIGLAGTTLAANASCTFTLKVTGTTTGLKPNVTGTITSTETGPGNTANANVTVNPVTGGPFAWIKPVANDVLVRATTYPIQWQGGDPGWNVEVYLQRISLNQVNAVVVSDVPNGGTANWQVPTSLAVATNDYMLCVRNMQATLVGCSAAFTITDTPPPVGSKLAFAQQPQNGTLGTNVSTMTVVVLDSSGVVVASDNATNVTLSLLTGPAGGAFNCTTPTQKVTAGVTQYPTCSVTKAGTYTVRATAPGLAAADSAPFTFTALAKLVFGAPLPFATLGFNQGVLNDVRVEVQDAATGQVMTTDSRNITLQQVSPLPGHGKFGCPTPSRTQPAQNGVATFKNCTLTGFGNITLEASASGVTSVVFTIKFFGTTLSDTDHDGIYDYLDQECSGFLHNQDLSMVTFSDYPQGGSTCGRVNANGNTFTLADLPQPAGIQVKVQPKCVQGNFGCNNKNYPPVSLCFGRPNNTFKMCDSWTAYPGGTYPFTDPEDTIHVEVTDGGLAEYKGTVNGLTYVVSIESGGSASVTETTDSSDLITSLIVSNVVGPVTINGTPITATVEIDAFSPFQNRPLVPPILPQIFQNPTALAIVTAHRAPTPQASGNRPAVAPAVVSLRPPNTGDAGLLSDRKTDTP